MLLSQKVVERIKECCNNGEKYLNLEGLNIDFTDPMVLNLLHTCDHIEILNASSTEINDFSYFSNLINLREISFAKTNISDLSVLAGLRSLEKLDISNTSIQKLAGVEKLLELSELYVSNTKVESLEVLSNLKKLTVLDLSGTFVRDLLPLKLLSEIETLNISGTDVVSLQPVEHLKKLSFLSIANTRISDLAPLLNLNNLATLDLGNCKLNSDVEDLWFKECLRVVKFEGGLIPGVPVELLSQNYLDNCLKRLRIFFLDISNGKEVIKDVKLFVLGNGRVGKTQICGRLRGDLFDDNASSTHGVQVLKTTIGEGDELLNLHMWDFGGQDIYHGTHALFVKSKAVFLLAWCPEIEALYEYETENFTSRNFPLSYWIEYVLQIAGNEVPLLIVQTQCDTAETNVVRQYIEDEQLKKFQFQASVLQYSAKTNLRRAGLDEALLVASRWLLNRSGFDTYVGKGWAKIRHKLEALKDFDQLQDVGERQNRIIEYADFIAMCEQAGDISDPKVLLHYLHNSGVVFYQKDLFNGKVVLDQQWALEAIYTFLDKNEPFNIELLQKKGQFTLSMVGRYLWDEKYKKDEQFLFIKMMEECGICFVYENSEREQEITYIVPDALLDLTDQELEEGLQERNNRETYILSYAPFLPPDLIRMVIADIGRQAGYRAKYWRNGVSVYEANTDSHGIIEQVRNEKSWRGEIHLRTCGRSAELLRSTLIDLIQKHEKRLGITGVLNKWLEPEDLSQNINPRYEIAPPKNSEYFISYSISNYKYDEIEKVVNLFCDEAKKRKIDVVRDRTHLLVSQDIIKFMKDVGSARKIVIFLSEKYLQSESCMFELFEMWRTSGYKKEIFLSRVTVYHPKELDIASSERRQYWQKYWEKRYNKEKLISHKLSPGEYEKFKLMNIYSTNIRDILEAVSSVLQPQTANQLFKHIFEK